MRLAVIGAGTMGTGIAQVAALAGHATRLTDHDPGARQRAWATLRQRLAGAVARGKLSQEQAEAVLERIVWCDQLAAAADGAEVVIEAIVEDLAAKERLFGELDLLAPADALLGTNTSSLSVGRIAQATRRPGRVIGLHFFNPPHAMKLLEIVTHSAVDPGTVERARALAASLGKEAIVVRDTPGFASSRLGVVLGLEAMRMVEQGVASVEDIDKAMELGYGHPMGPLKVSDLVGLDVRLQIAEYLFGELQQPQYRPPAILRKKVESGELGKKTGKGFYQWPTEPS